MARSYDDIEAEIARLREEQRAMLTEEVNARKWQAVEAIEWLHEHQELSPAIEQACTDKRGTFNPKRVFKMRK